LAARIVRKRITASAEAPSSMGEVTVDLLETFKVDGLPDLADTSKSTVLADLRRFVRDSFRRGWIKKSLVDRVKPASRRLRNAQPPLGYQLFEVPQREAISRYHLTQITIKWFWK
jgi:hypothetical protein